MIGLLLATSMALATERADAALLSFYGTGRVTAPRQAEAPLTVGASLPPGTLVCTDADSYATIRLALAEGGHDHDDVSLLPRTCLTIESVSARADGRRSVVSVSAGSVSVQDAPDQGHNAVVVRTRDGVTTGENGGFRVHVEDTATRTEALQHPVSLRGADVEVQVGAGEGSRVREGQAPEAPVPLPKAGAPESPEDDAVLRVPVFRWSAVDRVIGYRVELSVSPAFDQIVLAEEVATATWAPELLLLPFRVPGLWWRVSSVDRTGFIGVPSAARRLEFPAGLGP